jgi:hypothetical protein
MIRAYSVEEESVEEGCFDGQLLNQVINASLRAHTPVDYFTLYIMRNPAA